MLKFARIVMLAAASLGLTAAAAHAVMLGSASRTAGIAIAVRAEAVSQDRQATHMAPAFSPRLYLTLTIVNQLVNAEPAARPQLRAYWPAGLIPIEGEAAARAKRDRLIHHGLPANALRLAPREDDAGRRIVLVVETSAGDFVLDSLSSRVAKEALDESHTASVPLKLPELRFR